MRLFHFQKLIWTELHIRTYFSYLKQAPFFIEKEIKMPWPNQGEDDLSLWLLSSTYDKRLSWISSVTDHALTMQAL